MDGMKCALEQRGWSTPMSEQVGATFGAMLFSLMPTPNPPKKGTP
jgi:hypothetical protein